MHTRITLSLALLLLAGLIAQADGDREVPRAEREGDRERPRRDRERGDAPRVEREGERDRPRHDRERGEERERRENRERDGDRERQERDARGRDPLSLVLRGRRSADAIMGLLREHFGPELGELEQVAQCRPDEAVEFAHNLVRQAAGLLELRENNPERFAKIMAARQLDQRTHELAAQYRRAQANADREKLAKELASVLEEAFAARLAVQQEELDEMGEELRKRQQALAERKQNRSRIIKRRLNQLTGQGEELEW